MSEIDIDKIIQIIDEAKEYFGANDIVVKHVDNTIIVVGAPRAIMARIDAAIKQQTGVHPTIVDVQYEQAPLPFTANRGPIISEDTIKQMLTEHAYTPDFTKYRKQNHAQYRTLRKTFTNAQIAQRAKMYNNIKTKRK